MKRCWKWQCGCRQATPVFSERHGEWLHENILETMVVGAEGKTGTEPRSLYAAQRTGTRCVVPEEGEHRIV